MASMALCDLVTDFRPNFNMHHLLTSLATFVPQCPFCSLKVTISLASFVSANASLPSSWVFPSLASPYLSYLGSKIAYTEAMCTYCGHCFLPEIPQDCELFCITELDDTVFK